MSDRLINIKPRRLMRAQLVSEDLGDLISSSGPEFRPLETRVGPDGAIYICDWLNPVIGHYRPGRP